jgi:general secretion pathway protein D
MPLPDLTRERRPLRPTAPPRPRRLAVGVCLALGLMVGLTAGLTLGPVTARAQAVGTAMTAAVASVPQLDPKILDSRLTLRLRDVPLRLALDSLERSTGLRLNLDNTVGRELKVTLFVEQASVREVLDLLMATEQLAMRPIDGRTLVMFPDTPAKRMEYELLQLRVVPLRHADANAMATLLKTMLKNPALVAEVRSNALVLRDTPERLALAEQLLRANDRSGGDVRVDFEVVEVSRQRLSDLGIGWPEGLSLSLSPGTVGGWRAAGRDSWNFTPLSASLNLRWQDIDGAVLASPRVRVRDREKGRVMVGDKVPTITTTLVANAASAGSGAGTGTGTGTGTATNTAAATLTGSVQYVDVGLKIEVEPRIHGDDEVSLKLDLEISRIAQTLATASGQAYQIGTRNVQTSMRLRDGETQWLAGLISRRDRSSNTGLPGLALMPVAGRLFGHDSEDLGDTELMLSVTPHIQRQDEDPTPREREFDSGTDTRIRARAWGVSPAGEDAVFLSDVEGPGARAVIRPDAPPQGFNPAMPGVPNVVPRPVRGARPLAPGSVQPLPPPGSPEDSPSPTGP